MSELADASSMSAFALCRRGSRRWWKINRSDTDNVTNRRNRRPKLTPAIDNLLSCVPSVGTEGAGVIGFCSSITAFSLPGDSEGEAGRVLLKRGGGGLGGGGGLEPKSPKVCVPKTAKLIFPFVQFHFFPL